MCIIYWWMCILVLLRMSAQIYALFHWRHAALLFYNLRACGSLFFPPTFRQTYVIDDLQEVYCLLDRISSLSTLVYCKNKCFLLV